MKQIKAQYHIVAPTSMCILDQRLTTVVQGIQSVVQPGACITAVIQPSRAGIQSVVQTGACITAGNPGS